MRPSTPHPSDAALLAWVSGTSDHQVEAHVRTCTRCQGRTAGWEALGASLGDTLVAEADLVMDEGRLAHQRAAILRRISGARARVLPFPGRVASTPRRPVLGPDVRRWIAIAALVGLVVGTIAGRFILEPHGGAFTRSPGTAADVLPGAGGPSLLLTSGVGSSADEAFLVELDAALVARGPRSLRALDALTPDVVEVQAAGR
jgi:hypothetical protein